MSEQDQELLDAQEREEMIADFIRVMESIDAARAAAGDELESTSSEQVVQ